jgi:UV DNA damage repair endonuclease
MTTNQSVHRIGFACKFVEINKKGEVASIPGLNTGGTTLAWLKRQKRDVAESKLIEVMTKNVTHTHNLVKKIATLEPELRMVRLTSDMLTGYTHPDYQDFYKSPDVISVMEKLFAPVGETARNNDVRLSFHPDQFVVLASDRPEVVEKSIEEFEYHVDMARMMGYGRTFQDMKINVHISGRQGPDGIRKAYSRLSQEARNMLTIENEEMSYGLNEVLQISDIVPIVMDIHHHWVRQGEYISADDPRVRLVLDSWHGLRPTLHFSVSREDILTNHPTNQLPNRDALMEQGFNKQKLRAHSDYYWNDSVNEWALTFYDKFDIMCESKSKNLASFKLLEQYKRTHNV